MNKLNLVLLLTSLITINIYDLNVNAQSSKDWKDKVLGSYQSKIENGDVMASGVTQFNRNKDSSIGGNYSMNENDEIVRGTLSQCQAVKGKTRVMNCKWNDRYGNGNLQITFSQNFSSFKGYWGENNSNLKYHWSGLR